MLAAPIVRNREPKPAPRFSISEVLSLEEEIFEDALAEVLELDERERAHLPVGEQPAPWTSVAGSRGRGRGRLTHAKPPAPRLPMGRGVDAKTQARSLSPTLEQSELLA